MVRRLASRERLGPELSRAARREIKRQRSIVRVAAIDLGRARVGIAVSDELGVLAHPRPHLSGKDRAGLLVALTRLASDEGVERFLVGLPRLLDGSEGIAARQARRFADALTRTTGLPVTLCDERLTTVEAQRRLREQGRDVRQSRDRIDSAAAAVLLQSWLDGQRSGGEAG
jgi:putative Holliday junction resolvase